MILASSSSSSTSSDGSPRRDFVGRPTRRRCRRGARRRRRSRATSQITWMRPERSTRSRKTSLPIPAAPSPGPPGGANRRSRRRSRAARPPRGRGDLVPVGKALRCGRLGHERIVRPRVGFSPAPTPLLGASPGVSGRRSRCRAGGDSAAAQTRKARCRERRQLPRRAAPTPPLLGASPGVSGPALAVPGRRG